MSVVKKPVSQPKKSKREKKSLKLSWKWPTMGKVVRRFNHGQLRKGIDIAGQLGQQIIAAESGEVVYSNNNLRGYGNLVIIKHSDQYLSAYAYNKTMVVTERDQIKKGQRIATMGSMEDQQAVLHFEISAGSHYSK